MISALCHPRPAEHSSTLLYPASGEEPPGEGESEAALRLPKAESRRQPEIQYTRALAEVNSGLDLLTHSILQILAPRYRRVKSGELCGKTRHTFFSSARKVRGEHERIHTALGMDECGIVE